jgi:hypothetical protein
MPDISIIKLKVRRGTDAQRRTVVLEQGELGYAVDTDRLYVGNGVLSGGVPVGVKLTKPLATVSSLTSIPGAELYDIVCANSMLYQLTKPNSDDISSWEFIGARVDNETIQYNTNGTLGIKNNSIDGNKFASSSVFNQGGIIATSTNGLSANVDNSTIKINSNRLAVGTLSASNISFRALGNGLSGGDGNLISINGDPSIFRYNSGVLTITALPPGVVSAQALSSNSIGAGLYIDTDNKLKSNIQTVNSSLTIDSNKQLSITPITVAGATTFSNISYNANGQILSRSSAIVRALTGNQSTSTNLSTFNGFPTQTTLTTQSRIAAVSGSPSGSTVNITLTSAGFISIDTTEYGLVAIPIFKYN